jgi:AraC-like DNA-binding protein
MYRKALLLILLLLLLQPAAKLAAQSQCRVTHYDEFSGMAQWYVTQIVQDRQGMIWFATWNGLNRYDGYEFACFKSRVGDGVDMASDRIQDMMLTKDGNLLCYVEGRTYIFNVSTCLFSECSPRMHTKYDAVFKKRHQQELANDRKPYSFTDPYGTQWRISPDGSMSYTDKLTQQHVPYVPDGDRMKGVHYCMTDNSGNIWLRSHYGAYRLTFTQKPYTMFAQERPAQVRCLFLDKKQRYWISSKDDATIRLFDKTNRPLGYLGRDGKLHPRYTSFGSPVYGIIQDTKGVFWLCSKPDGLFRMRETSEGLFAIDHFMHLDTDKSSLNCNDLYFIAEDKLGRMWIATFGGGINCIERPYEEKLQALHQDNGLAMPGNGLRVRQIHITADGKLLAPTTTGLLVADVSAKDARSIKFRRHGKEVNRSSSLSNNAAMYVTEDSKHRIYVCTESGGVNQIVSGNLLADRLEFRHFNMATGLASDVALSAIPSGDDIVVVSNNQVFRLNPDTDEPQDYESFFWRDRLRFSDAVPLKLPDGRSIFGLQDGAFVIRLEKIHRSTFVPPVVLTKLSRENDAENLAVNMTDTIILMPMKRDLFVQFAALDYAAEGAISYAFRLGTDGAWNHIGRDHSATFLDLKPGVYQLQIRSTNGDGVWVDNIRTVTIISKAAFWETSLAKLVYALISILVIWSIFHTRQHIINLNRRQKELYEAYLALLNASNPGPDPAKTNEMPAKPHIKPEDEAFMAKAMKFIEENISNPNINIGDMADATATSRTSLNRKMKSLLGVTPLDFIREARIRKACQMLKDGLPVNDVAYNCGFSDPKYFGKCFKSETGLTPTEYKVEKSSR